MKLLLPTLLLISTIASLNGQTTWKGEIPDPEIIIENMEGKPYGPFAQTIMKVRLRLQPDLDYYNFDPGEAEFIASDYSLVVMRGDRQIAEVKIDIPYEQPNMWDDAMVGVYFGELNTELKNGDQLIITAFNVRRSGKEFKAQLQRVIEIK